MKTQTKQELTHGQSQAKAQYESIVEMVNALNDPHISPSAREQAQQTIEEDPLSVCVRCSTFVPVGQEQEIDEYEILLCTGGPACRIIGELDQYKQPTSARIEHQDWGTPWTPYWKDVDEDVLLKYASVFYYGE